MPPQFQIASVDDVEQLKKFEIPYAFQWYIDDEINGHMSSHFRWTSYKENQQVVAFHRSMILSGWGYLAGIAVKPEVSNIWLLGQLTRFATDDLSQLTSEGVLAWAESPFVPKVMLMRRFGFQLYPTPIYRFIFDQETLLFSSNRQEGDTTSKWEIAVDTDYPQIRQLLNYRSSYIDSLPKTAAAQDQWLVYREAREIVAAIRWWLHGDVIEIHFTLSKKVDFDMTDGIFYLVNHAVNNGIQVLKLNLEAKRKLTLMRLLLLRPKTYRHGYSSYLLIKK